MTDPVRVLIISELGRIAAGVAIGTLALAALAVFLLWMKTRDRALLHFGLFAGLYGARLLAGTRAADLLFGASATSFFEAGVTYVINIPALAFVEEMLGRGWRAVVVWLRGAWVVFAGVAFLGWALGRDAGWAGPGNNVMVVLQAFILIPHVFRRDRPASPDVTALRVGFLVFGLLALNENLVDMGLVPWRLKVEAWGFIFFLLCLGYGIAERVVRGERRLVSIDQELQTARRIQASLLPSGPPRLPGLALAVRYVPLAAVAGDFYEFLPGENGGVGILVADVCGHGVGAALIASMVKVAAAAQTGRAKDPGLFLTEMNRTLCDKVEGRVDALREGGTLLGPFPEARYQATDESVRSGDRLLLYTDGLLEAASPAGDFFEEARLVSFLEQNRGLAVEPFAEALLDRLTQWSGGAGKFADDVTLVVVDVL